jgi:hypothetical protein
LLTYLFIVFHIHIRTLQTELQELTLAQKQMVKVVDRANGAKRNVVQFATDSPKTLLKRESGGCKNRPHVSTGGPPRVSSSGTGTSWIRRVQEGTAPGYGFGNSAPSQGAQEQDYASEGSEGSGEGRLLTDK